MQLANSFVLKVIGATTMDQEQLESALHTFLLQHQYLQSENGNVHVVHIDDVTTIEYEDES